MQGDTPPTADQAPASPPPEKKKRRPRSDAKVGYKPTPERAMAILEATASPKRRRDIAQITGLADRPTKALSARSIQTIEEYTELFRAQAQELVAMGLQRIRETLPGASVGQATMTVGILSDKLHQARPRNGDVHLHLHTAADRSALLGSLLGTAETARNVTPAPSSPEITQGALNAPQSHAIDIPGASTETPPDQPTA